MGLAVVLYATALAVWPENSASIMLTVVGSTQITNDGKIGRSETCS